MNKATKEHLAKLNFCRKYLHLNGFLDDRQSKKVHDRICRYQDKNRIEITEEELSSVNIKYKPIEQNDDKQNNL